MKLRSFFVPLACLFALAKPATAEVINIGLAEFQAMLVQGVPVVDVRTAGEWHQTGVVNGSQLITLFDETGRSDPELWKKQMAAVVEPAKPVILICRSGNRSSVGARLLDQQNPARKIYNVRDGMNGWRRAAQPVVTVRKNLETAGIACTPRC